MKKRAMLLIVALVFAANIFTGSAYGEYTCQGSPGAISVDDLRVPQGATCTLDGAYVDGNIKVERNATLRASGVRVIGNVQSENAAQVDVLSGSSVGGNIQIKQGGGARIEDVSIKGDLQFEENRRSLTADNNIIGGNLQAFKNKGGLSITENTIDANLQCKENWPAPTGGDNIVKGNKEDQCAHLQPPPAPPPPPALPVKGSYPDLSIWLNQWFKVIFSLQRLHFADIGIAPDPGQDVGKATGYLVCASLTPTPYDANISPVLSCDIYMLNDVGVWEPYPFDFNYVAGDASNFAGWSVTSGNAFTVQIRAGLRTNGMFSGATVKTLGGYSWEDNVPGSTERWVGSLKFSGAWVNPMALCKSPKNSTLPPCIP